MIINFDCVQLRSLLLGHAVEVWGHHGTPSLSMTMALLVQGKLGTSLSVLDIGPRRLCRSKQSSRRGGSRRWFRWGSCQSRVRMHFYLLRREWRGWGIVRSQWAGSKLGPKLRGRACTSQTWSELLDLAWSLAGVGLWLRATCMPRKRWLRPVEAPRGEWKGWAVRSSLGQRRSIVRFRSQRLLSECWSRSNSNRVSVLPPLRCLLLSVVVLSCWRWRCAVVLVLLELTS